MELAGSTSWRFEESARDDLPHLALFVRDAVALAVGPGPEVPPRLAGGVPDHSDVLREHERQDAGRQWAGWWAAVMDVQIRPLEAPPDLRDVSDLRARREQAGAPPDFAALVDRPALHRAVVESFAEAHRWVGRRRLEVPVERQGCFPYRLVRQVAEDVAFDRSVDAGAVRGRAVVLDVEGSWWHPLGPGVVVCSMAVTADPALAESVLRQAFESGLRR